MAVPSATSSFSPNSQPPLSSIERRDVPPFLPVHIRGAQPTDVPALITMKKQMAAEENAAGYFDGSPEHWERDFFGAAPRFLAIVAECVGTPVGMAIFNEQPMAGWPAPPIYIQTIFVRPECRQHGIGRALMVAITTEAQRRGSHLLYLNVRQDNAARRLYEKGGFVHADSCLVYTMVLPQLLGAASAAMNAAAMRAST